MVSFPSSLFCFFRVPSLHALVFIQKTFCDLYSIYFMEIIELCAWHFCSLTFCSLSENGISGERVCVLLEALKVNQSHQKLELK